MLLFAVVEFGSGGRDVGGAGAFNADGPKKIVF